MNRSRCGPDTGLATWRLDGFMSINANSVTGTLTTRPLTFSGERLVINADAEEGEIVVEVLDASGGPIPGFEAQNGAPLRNDRIRHEVAWKQDAEFADLAGQPVKLRFHMRCARLYSFTFENGEPHIPGDSP